MSTSTLLTSLFQFKAWANEELFAGLLALSETTHQAERHSAIRILNHIHVVDRIFAGNLQRAAHSFSATNTPETPTLAALHSATRESDRWYLAYVAALTPSALSEDIEFAFVDGALARMSREEMLAHVITHGAYHRGAVGRIMVQLTIAPPRDVYTGFLHATEPNRRERV